MHLDGGMLPPLLLVLYVVVGALDVIGEAASLDLLVVAAKPLLVPLLAAWLVATARRQAVRSPLTWLLAGLGFAWLGDLALMADGNLFFALGLVGFLAMQACYILAFTRVPGPGLVRAWKVALVPFIAYWIGMNLLVWPGAGTMRIPVLVYSAVLLAMAAAALDLVLRVPRPLGWRVFWGAALFVVSDSLIAVTAFGPLESSPGLSAAVMSTYIAAQALIITGFARAVATR